MKNVFPFTPARLVQGTSWYVIFYQTSVGNNELTRIRRSFDLNRIPDLKERLRRGGILVKALNEKLLPKGYPFMPEHIEKREFKKAILEVEEEEDDVLGQTTLLDALQKAVEVKTTSDRQQSNREYLSMNRIFSQWVKSEKMEGLCIKDFSRRTALEFMDYSTTVRKINNNTYNNYLGRMSLLCKELCVREYIQVNPFQHIPRKRKLKKSRRNFTDQEKLITLEFAWKNDFWFAIAILLQYIGFIRPCELRRLKFGHFNLDKGLILLPAEITKSRIDRIVTIPSQILPLFFTSKFSKWPTNYFVFGENMLPHPTKKCGVRSLNAKHNRILNKLYESGDLHELTGLSFYSWKDTGMTDASDMINIKDVQMQAGHQNIEDTMKYIHPHLSNQGMQNLKVSLLEKIQERLLQ